MKSSLFYLTEGDWKLLRAHAVQSAYQRDGVIVREGAEARGVMILESGSARVEQTREGMIVTLARIGPGEVIGEMSVLEEALTSASVIADEPATAVLFERGHVGALLESDPGLSARFYRSLAIHLSRRLRESSRLISRLNVQTVAQGNRFHATRLGQITARQLPRSLVAGVEAFKAKMTTISARPGPSAEGQVTAACGALVELLQRSTSPEALYEISASDLGAFRDQAQVAVGVGAYVFRETFSWFMSAATVARAYMKPRGFPEDHETAELVYEADADGDGAVGPLIDQFYLSRPICRSRREGRELMRALLRKIAADARATGRASIASLASGTGREAIELAADPALPYLRVTCVDLDPEALAAGARLADELDAAPRVAFVRASVVPAPEEGAPAPLGRHDAVYALGLLEYLSEDECVRALDAAFDALAPGGTFATTTLGPANPDRAFMEHILEWRVHHRAAGELEAIFTRSRFAAKPRIEPFTEGTGLLVTVKKG